jgi:hypothetical protein
MTSALIHDRGRGPEIIGTRITVYNLLTHFLDPTMTEARICIVNDLTPEQVAAARAYVLNHADTVLAEHLRIEERIAADIERMASEAPSRDAEQARGAKATFQKFKEWLAVREAEENEWNDDSGKGEGGAAGRLPPFREWLQEQESRTRSATGS